MRRLGQGRVLYPAPVIDFDHNASTSLAPEVAEEMARLQRDTRLQGNPSSVHGRGRQARKLLEDARRMLAAAVDADPLGITFTSGGTEADNLALLGLAGACVWPARGEGTPDFTSTGHVGVLSSALEHPAVSFALSRLERLGHPVHRVPPDAQGRITPAAVSEALRAAESPRVLSLMWANHELGNAYDLPAIVEAVRAFEQEQDELSPAAGPDTRIQVHSDAVQALGKVPLAFRASGLDAMSISSHKVRGPKGIGALVHRKSLRLHPIWGGGHQERGLRTGTESPIAAMGFALAATHAVAQVEARRAHLEPLRERLREGLKTMPGVQLHGDPSAHTANTVCASFEGCKGELLMMSLDLEGVCVSTGSACSAGTLEPSPVLLALGLDPARAQGALRFSLGPDSQAAEVDRVLELLEQIVPRVRKGSVP